jgi:LysM repeat protein
MGILLLFMPAAWAEDAGAADQANPLKRPPHHWVNAGETLGGIAEKYGCTKKRLMEANGLKSAHLIRTGKRLKLPNCGPMPRKKVDKDAAKVILHEVGRGETLGEIAALYGTTVEAITERNRIRGDFIRTGQEIEVVPTIAVRPRRKMHYEIQPRDTLMSIAERFRMTWQEVKRLNYRVKDTNKLKIGQVLVVYADGPERKSQAIGRPNAGRLVNGERLPRGPGYYRRRPHLSWGTNETITNLTVSIGKVRTKIKRVHDVAIGNISAQNGGRLPPHKSHQSGRDVDIGFWFTDQPKGGPKGFISGLKHPLHYAANWAFVEALCGKSRDESRVEYIFLDYLLQARLYRYAKRKGVPKRRLDWLFQFPHGRRALRGIIRHSKGHDDHFHIRFRCPPGDRHCA